MDESSVLIQTKRLRWRKPSRSQVVRMLVKGLVKMKHVKSES